MAEAFFFVAMLSAASDLAPPDRRGEALSLGVARAVPRARLRAAAGRGWRSAPAATRPSGSRPAALAGLAAVLAVPLPETSPAVVSGTGERVRTRLFHPAAVFPGVLVGCGRSGMAGFLAFMPLYARELGLDGAGAAAGGVRADRRRAPLRLRQAARPGRCGQAVGRRARGRGRGPGADRPVRRPDRPRGRHGGVRGRRRVRVPGAALARGVARRRDGAGLAVGTTSVFLDASFGIAPAVFGGDRPDLGIRRRVPAGRGGRGPRRASCSTVRRASLVASDPGGVRSGA